MGIEKRRSTLSVLFLHQATETAEKRGGSRMYAHYR